jgi:hypothetical protein
MRDAGSYPSLRATQIGPVAVRALREATEGTVRAVFDRSYYVTLASGWLCVGPAKLGAGPLNILCGEWPENGPHELLEVGDIARVEHSVLSAGRTRVRIDTAAPWHPEPCRAWSRASLARGLSTLAASLPAVLPEDGLARLLRDGDEGDTPTLTAAQAPARHLAQILEAAASGRMGIEAQPLTALIGLGPGLTPSGDDYLGGALVALAVTAQVEVRDRIWRVLEPHLRGLTSDISCAHLDAAAQGFGSAALHEVLRAILSGATEAVPAALQPLIAIGHTSGWDALAGAAMALRALARSPTLPGPLHGKADGAACRVANLGNDASSH